MSELYKEIASVESAGRYNALFQALRHRYTQAGLPLKGTFELTPHCTLDCKMCYVHTSNNAYPGKVLTGDQWIQAIDEAVDGGMLYCGLTGGECFLHPDFKRIYQHLKERGVYVLILSNGTLIDEETVRWLKKMPPRCIRISVYGSNPEVYERVTGSAQAFYAVDKALTLLKEANILTDIQITVSKYNFDDFENLLEYAKRKNNGLVNTDCELFQARPETGRQVSDYALSIEEQAEIWQRGFRVNGYECSPACDEDFSSLQYDLGEPDASYPEGMPCTAGMCSFTIGYDGVMVPCNDLELARQNILEGGLMAAWKTINEATKGYLRSEECRSCKYFGSCNFCAARYCLASGGKNGLPGNLPCNIRQRTLPLAMRKKFEKENIT